MFRENDAEYRECVSCDFTDKMMFKPQPRELETRVNQTEEKVKQETQVLTFSPNSPSK